jgi:hypothetical protein
MSPRDITFGLVHSTELMHNHYVGRSRMAELAEVAEQTSWLVVGMSLMEYIQPNTPIHRRAVINVGVNTRLIVALP